MATGNRIVLISLLLVLLAGLGLPTAYAQSAHKGDPNADLSMLQDFWKVKVQQGVAKLLPPSAQSSARLPGGLTRDLLAKAETDECFYGVGDSRNGAIPSGGCPSGARPKVNQAYVWGLAKAGSNLWFGTAPNVHCLVIGGYLGVTEPILEDSYVCEFGQSGWVKQLPPQYQPAAAPIGDWRPPKIFTFDTTKRLLTEKTPLVVGEPHLTRLNSTIGLRSAGALGSVVFLGGPGMQGGINLFAFDAVSGDFLGSANLSSYTNIRKWLVVDGVLYAGVAARTGGGRVLRWMGGNAGGYDPSKLFEFAEVGRVAGDAAELAVHEGRIFVSTWPGTEFAGGGSVAGLFMSPPIPAGGFTSSAVTDWTKVWDATFYEPDPVTARTYGGGALASFDGYLYWGTMHVPMLSTLAHFRAYNYTPDQTQLTAAILGTYRAISIFRGRNFASAKPEMEVLYGESMLPVYRNGSWTMAKTGMGKPKWGSSGMGNFFNNYTWAMAVFKNKLYVGTMDWGYLASDLMDALAKEMIGVPLGSAILPLNSSYGADLFSFASSRSAATQISKDGMGNYLSYGIRNMLATSDALYLGMANPMNLMTDPKDNKPEGGWELIQVKGQ